MFLTLTAKMEAESKEELIETFPSQVMATSNSLEELKQADIFGPKDKVKIRVLVIGGGWREEAKQDGPTEDQVPNLS